MEPVVAQYVAAIQRNEKIEPIRCFSIALSGRRIPSYARVLGHWGWSVRACPQCRNREIAKGGKVLTWRILCFW